MGTLTDLRPYMGSLAKAVPPGLMPKTLKAFDSRWLGCGSFGCAYRARRRGWVLKITDDPSEALVASLGAKLYKKGGAAREAVTAGMVKFGGIVALEGAVHPSGQVFLIWREEASKVGDLFKKDKDAEEIINSYETALWDLKDRYDPFFGGWRDPKGLLKIGKVKSLVTYKRAMKPIMRAAGAMRFSPKLSDWWGVYSSIRDFVRDKPDPFDFLMKVPALRKDEVLLQATAAIAEADVRLKLLNVAVKQKVKPVSRLEGMIKTLTYLTKNGAYLYDLHDGNMGYVRRGKKKVLVITDPKMFVIKPWSTDMPFVPREPQ
jgi:hypothetical protein